MATVQIKKLNERAKLPTTGSQYAAGYDLYACLDGDGAVTIPPHHTAADERAAEVKENLEHGCHDQNLTDRALHEVVIDQQQIEFRKKADREKLHCKIQVAVIFSHALRALAVCVFRHLSRASRKGFFRLYGAANHRAVLY